MRHTYLIFIFLVLFSLASVSAYDYEFVQNEPATVSFPVSLSNQRLCGSCECNITINYPNGTPLLDKQGMTFSGGYCTKTILAGQLSIIGEYSGTIETVGEGEWGTEEIEVLVDNRRNKIDPMVSIVALIGLMFFIKTFIYRINRFAGNVMFLLSGLGMVYLFSDYQEVYMLFAGVLVALGGLVNMLIDLTRS